ncbi:MAG: thiamine-phosphate kinase [Opitutales bacterium]
MHPFVRRPSESVAALGEARLLTLIRGWLGAAAPAAPFGMGDDCAVLPAVPRRQLLTVDPVIYGRHFDDRVPPQAVGAKLLKRNLSDLAAMGGRPTAAVIALSLDARTSVKWLEAFYRGLAACARRHGVAIVGGDVAQADHTLAASLTLLGTATGPRFLTRAGARPGDWIYVTGRLGGSRSSGHHYRFTPRLREGSWLARQREVRAMMDLSDGLAKDVHALTPPGCRPAIQARVLPLRPGCDVAAALTDGEDYELLFVVAQGADRAAFARRWRRAFPRPALTCLGRFERKAVPSPGTLDLGRYHGYEHLR